MKKEMLINVLQPEECRIAIIEDGVLEELYVERTSHESYTGNIYKGGSSTSSRRSRPPLSTSRSAVTAFCTSPTSSLNISIARRACMTSRGPTRVSATASAILVVAAAATIADALAGPEQLDPPPGGVPTAPPRLEERPRDRGRDRDKDRGRERERPDLSIRGRRDRSEPPSRRFGEGLVEPAEDPPATPRAVEPAPIQPYSPFEEGSVQPAQESEQSVSASWPEAAGHSWDRRSEPIEPTGNGVWSRIRALLAGGRHRAMNRTSRRRGNYAPSIRSIPTCLPVERNGRVAPPAHLDPGEIEGTRACDGTVSRLSLLRLH